MEGIINFDKDFLRYVKRRIIVAHDAIYIPGYLFLIASDQFFKTGLTAAGGT